MAKTTVPRAESPAQTIPLSDVTISTYREAHFLGEEGKQPVTITGRQLGQVLTWLLDVHPTIFDKPDDDVWDPGTVAYDLERLGDLLRGLSGANLVDVLVDPARLFGLLGEVTGDLAARLNAREDGDGVMKRTTITLPKRTEAAA
jgi:hypothetical protein